MDGKGEVVSGMVVWSTEDLDYWAETDPEELDARTEQEVLMETLAELHDAWSEANLANWAGDIDKVLLELVNLSDIARYAVESANERRLAGQTN